MKKHINPDYNIGYKSCQISFFFFSNNIIFHLSRLSPKYLGLVTYVLHLHLTPSITSSTPTPTSRPHITLNRNQLLLFRSSSPSSFFGIHFHDRSYSFQFLSPHNILSYPRSSPRLYFFFHSYFLHHSL